MSIVYVDVEVNNKNQVVKYGAYIDNLKIYRGKSQQFVDFIKGHKYICGHNVLMHDVNYINKEMKKAGISKVIDTLPLSALLFAKKPYHSLVKDYKLYKDDKNDPGIDSKLAFELFQNEIEEFNKLDNDLKEIYYGLLNKDDSFKYFFEYIGFKGRRVNLLDVITGKFENKICTNVGLKDIIKKYPTELAFALAIINVDHNSSIAPPWVVHSYKNYNYVMDLLRGTPCFNCQYCNENMDSVMGLRQFFPFDNYRLFKGEPLQKRAVDAQVRGKSIIVVFPTAGGKSITFQVPALMYGRAVKGLTVVISPLQSLMNDQVKNLEVHSNTNVGTINGGMNMLVRKETIDRVRDGDINLLYISPESLRSPSMLKLLSKRNIVRFVIDEAHCFSTWGHDFRVDYLYIAEFMKLLMEQSQNNKNIPVSCFTATAKKEVIEDIQNYFKTNLGHTMEVITTDTRRTNLNFYVHDCENHQEKMHFIKDLLEESEEKPVIIYTTRRKAAEKVAHELSESGFSSTVFHAGIEIKHKAENQRQFTEGEKNIIVATSAFGMGVDKSDVSYVIHYQISSSIEDYMQEAGRGGRDENIQAQCHILYNEADVEAHFSLLNQQKLSQNEINQIWRAIKNSTRKRNKISLSENELVRKAGWEENDDFDIDLKTKTKNCILALENVHYIKRHQNSPRIYATSLVPKTNVEASLAIDKIKNVSEEEKMHLRRVLSVLYTDKTTKPERGHKPISMIDDLYTLLEFSKRDLIKYVNILKEHKILKLDNDLFVHIPENYNSTKSTKVIETNILIMTELINLLDEKSEDYNIKELNMGVKERVLDCTVKEIKRILNYLDSLKLIKQSRNSRKKQHYYLCLNKSKAEVLAFIDQLGAISSFIVDYSYMKYEETEKSFANYSMIELKFEYERLQTLLQNKVSIKEIENALVFLHRIGSLIIDGGFLVVYNPMTIEKVEQIANKKYTKEDYKDFLHFYENKVRKIHLLIQFIKKLKSNTEDGLVLVDDYFNLDYKTFEKKYITKEYKEFIKHAMTETRYRKLNDHLSDKQKEIIFDKDDNKNIVVLAGPGSGKTTLLVHKLASLVRLEDKKLGELLMLTFSRSATVVFKKKLKGLIGNGAHYVDIKTFHSFCFDILGQVGDLNSTDNLFVKAIESIENKTCESSLINKTTLVIDEAQDMSEKEYLIVQALIRHNEKLKVIAVGDDDQNIYEFRDSDSKYFYDISRENCNKYELNTNYRSKSNLVEFTQNFIITRKERFKTELNESYTDKDGYIRIVKHDSEYMYEGLVNQIKNVNNKTSMAVLTYTNLDAEIMASLLTKAGLRIRLLQGNINNLKIDLLDEVDYFIRQFIKENKIILEETWNEKLNEFKLKFKNNPLYEDILNLFEEFAITYPKTKYRIDLITFLQESNLEDLYKNKPDIITVANYHKSKGTEFESVFVLLDKKLYKEEDKRALYVAMTRAKTNLIIHTNGTLLDGIDCQNLKTSEDHNIYDEPDELIYQMNHSDVNLGWSRYNVWKVRTGMTAKADSNACYFNDEDMIKYSTSMKIYIESKLSNGYEPYKAVVTFKVKWFNKEKDKYFLVLLPKLYFKKCEVIDIETNE